MSVKILAQVVVKIIYVYLKYTLEPNGFKYNLFVSQQ